MCVCVPMCISNPRISLLDIWTCLGAPSLWWASCMQHWGQEEEETSWFKNTISKWNSWEAEWLGLDSSSQALVHRNHVGNPVNTCYLSDSTGKNRFDILYFLPYPRRCQCFCYTVCPWCHKVWDTGTQTHRDTCRLRSWTPLPVTTRFCVLFCRGPN